MPVEQVVGRGINEEEWQEKLRKIREECAKECGYQSYAEYLLVMHDRTLYAQETNGIKIGQLKNKSVCHDWDDLF